MSKLVMGYWDCPVCGTKEIRGDVANCPACGRARGDVQFYVKDYQEGQSLREEELSQFEQLDDEKAQSFSKNPDWYCSFCNSLNSDNAKFCNNCGASREDSESNYFQMLQKKKEREAAEAAAQPQVSAPQAKRRSPMTVFLVILLAIVAFFVWMNGNKTSGDLTVTSLAWQRNIQIEENREYSESGWALPQGAELTSQQQEIHHYDNVLSHYQDVEVQRSRQVFDHYDTYYTYEDRGNGTFEQIQHQDPVYRTEYYTETESQPVYVPVPRYATKYYYKIWRWTPTRVATASGEDHNAAWPDTALGENEREGDRAEAYGFTVQDKDGKSSTYRIAESDWRNLNVGDGLYITAKRTGADAYISDKDGNRIADIVRVQ